MRYSCLKYEPDVGAFRFAHALHLQLGDGGQDKRHGHTEQSQLRRHQSSGFTLPLLALEELQTALKLHPL